MAHLMKYKEWESGSGQWYCNDTDEMCGSQAGEWWAPARMLEMTPAAFIELLVTKYKPDHIKWNGSLLIYSWNKEHYATMHSYLLWINRESRNRNFII